MQHLQSMMIFAKVIESGSFSKAAEQLGIAKSSVSKKVSELEKEFGVRLIQRSTRKLNVTEEGKALQVRGLQSFLDRMRTRAGITNARCSPHTFRHTFAVSYLRNGGNVFELQYLLGHSTLEMVKRYVSTLGMMDALASHSKFGPVDNLELR